MMPYNDIIACSHFPFAIYYLPFGPLHMTVQVEAIDSQAIARVTEEFPTFQ